MKKYISFNQFIIMLVFLVLIAFSFLVQKNAFVNLEVGQVVENDITSQKTLTYVDEFETSKQKELARSQVQEVYEKDNEVKESIIKNINTFLDSVIVEKNNFSNKEALTATKSQYSTNENKQKAVKEVENPFNMTDEEITYFFDLSESVLNSMRDVFGKEIEKTYNVGITEEQLETVVGDFENSSSFYFFSSKPRDILLTKVSGSLKPNMVLNDEETDARYKEAEKTISDVTKTVKRGEIVLRKGTVVQEEDLAVLKALGYTKQTFEVKDMVKKIPMIMIVFAMIHIFLTKFSPRAIKNRRMYMLPFSLLFVSVSLNQLIQNEFVTYILMMVSIMVVTTFISPKITLIYAMAIGMLINLADMQLILSALTMGIVIRYCHDEKADRRSYLNSGFITAFVLIIANISLDMFSQSKMASTDIYLLTLSPVLASSLAIGVFPYLELILGMVTPVKLHELTSTKHHLTQRIMDEIPGTYHHSMRVGQLAEAAADKIGANGLLVKVAAIFHDAGKLKNPKYFVENLTRGEVSPHKGLTPEQSADIIRQHPIDSVAICKKYNLPSQIIEIIEKHHGDDKVKYFYHMALNEGREVNEDDFTYQTPLPVTKEEGILMLADITEASSRAFINEEHHVARQKLTDIIYAKIEEKQLRECHLTIKEINIIVDTFLQFLLPSEHTRPAYPPKKEN